MNEYKPFRLLWESLGSRTFFLCMYASSMVANTLHSFMTIAFGHLIDAVQAAPAGAVPTFQSLLPLLAAVLGLNLLSHVFFRTTHLFEILTMPTMIARMRARLTQDVMKRVPTFFADELSGAIAQRIQNTPQTYYQVARFFQWTGVGETMVTLTTMGFCYSADVRLGLIMSGWLLVVIIYALWALPVRFAARVEKLASSRGQLMGRTVDMIANAQIILMQGFRSKYPQVLAPSIENEAVSLRRSRTAFALFQLGLGVIELVFLSGIIVFGAWLWTQHHLTTGLYVTAVMMAMRASGSLWLLAVESVDFFDGTATIRENLNFLSQYPRQTSQGTQALALKAPPAITFERITFRYPARSEPVFDDMTLHIRAGEKIGLIGKSGAGKTTLVNLLLGVYAPSAGRILFDDVAADSVDLDSLRQNIAIIPQDNTLFHASVLENIRFSKPDATDADIHEAARLAHADTFIRQLPEGYQSIVGERGVKLSGGQRQRIAIARAFLRRTPVLVLDEATSALDSESEHLIQQSLARLMTGKTVIAIAHRLSTLACMDRMIVLDCGRIAEEGTHGALLAQNGLYTRLWSLQSGGFLPEQ